MSRFNIFVAITLALLTACSSNDMDDVTDNDRIMLAAGIEEMEDNLRSRAPGDPAKADVVNDFSPGKPLVAAVWFSPESGKYSSTSTDDNTHLPAHITMKFNHRSKPAFALYDVENDLCLRFKSHNAEDKVYCVGLYPATGWSEETPPIPSTSTSHEINGCEDLMFAKEIAGDWTDRFGEGLNFKHLLTWVTVVVTATSHEAVDQWGDITHLEIGSQPTVTVDLTGNAADSKPNVSFSGDDTDFVISNTRVPLEITSQEIGSVLCSPKTTYNLELTTERFGKQNISMQIKDRDGNPITDPRELIGKNIVITLYFGNVLIDGRCTLNDWIPENEELHIYT